MMKKKTIYFIILSAFLFTSYYCFHTDFNADSKIYDLSVLNLRLKIEKVGKSEAIIFFAKDYAFGDDYIQFETNDLYQDIDIYLFKDYEVKVIGRKPLRNISERNFHITEFSVVQPTPGTHTEPYYTDSSFIKLPCAHMTFSKDMNGFSVSNDKTGEILYKASATLFAAETWLKFATILLFAVIALGIVALKK